MLHGTDSSQKRIQLRQLANSLLFEVSVNKVQDDSSSNANMQQKFKLNSVQKILNNPKQLANSFLFEVWINAIQDDSRSNTDIQQEFKFNSVQK